MTNPLDTTSTLAGTRDREKTADLLGQALAQGYLQIDEYDRRLQATFQAKPLATSAFGRACTGIVRKPLSHPLARSKDMRLMTPPAALAWPGMPKTLPSQ